MPDLTFFQRHHAKIVVALLLTFASGLVDIVGYIGVYHFFTAHLTGTTVQLGRSLAQRNFPHLFLALTVVSAFFAGSILGRSLIEIGSRHQFRRIASVTFALEALLLVFPIFTPDKAFLRLALLAAAMGLQTATLTGIGPLTVHTTFITGMINKLAQLVSHIAWSGAVARRSEEIQHKRRQQSEMAIFLSCVWLCYVGGAIAGTWSVDAIGIRALLAAVVLLSIGIAIDGVQPLAFEEEQEQSER